MRLINKAKLLLKSDRELPLDLVAQLLEAGVDVEALEAKYRG